MKARVIMFLIGLAVWLCLPACMQAPSSQQVSSSRLSPDGKYLAEVVETWVPERDRRFEVRITRKDVSRVQADTIYRSPDEGRPDERLLWSSDSRYLLLVGKYLVASPELVADTGETIYLLHDVERREMRCNSSQLPVRERGFDFKDLTGIDFGEKFKPAMNGAALRNGRSDK